RLMGLRRSWTWLVHYVCFMLTWTLSCVLVLALMTLVEGSQGVPFVYLANPMLVFVAMMLFASAYVLFGMLISLFFDKSSLAVAFGLLLWSATLVVPFLAWHWNNRTLTAYLGLSRWVKLATLRLNLRPKMPVSERKFDWPMIYKYALLKDNVLPFEIILVMGSMSGLFGFLIWYLEMVLPWTATIPEPLHFPFKASYWNVAEEEIKLPASHESIPDESQDNFEEEPRHLLLVVEALNISKVRPSYQTRNRKHAVDHLTLRLYHGQILVLLGHNGAGKTTLVNMLTGMLRPTSGTAIIEGFDLTKDLEDALVNVRLCPQKNLLYEQMTVYEHLFFFAAIQKVSRDVIVDQIDALVNVLRLGSFLTSFPRTLPAALKRKLCIALAIIADPKILVLDEPTAGLDPQSRHDVWELLQKARRSCTILLTTHNMEEADVLGDRIAIIAEGSIRCCGSPTFLKRKLGTGYHLKIRKRPKRCDVPGIISVVQSYVPTAHVVTDTPKDLRLAMGVTSSEGFPFVFCLPSKVLERLRSKMGILSVSVSVTTMEDVYWSVYFGVFVCAGLYFVVRFLQSMLLRIIKRPIFESVCTEIMGSESYGNGAGAVDLVTLRSLCKRRVSHVSTASRTKALMRKRLQYTRKQWKILLVGIVVPALIIFTFSALCIASASHRIDIEFKMKPVYKYDLKSMFGGGTLTVMSADESTFSMAHDVYQPLLQHHLSQVSAVRDVTDHVLELGNSNLNAYLHCLTGASFRKDTPGPAGDSKFVVTAWHNGEAYHTAAIALNLVHTALLRSLSDDKTASITLRVRPQRRLEESARQALTGSFALRAVVERTIAFSMAMALMISAFGPFPVADRVSKSKHLQLMTGLTGKVYWMANFLFDYIIYSLAVFCFVVVNVFFYSEYTVTMIGPMVFILAAYGLCIIPMTYLLSFVTHSPANCFSLVLIVCFFGSETLTFTTVAFIALPPTDLTPDASGWSYVPSLRPLLTVHPSFSLVLAFIRTMEAGRQSRICSRSESLDPARALFWSQKSVYRLLSSLASYSGQNLQPALLFAVLLMYRDSGSYGRFRTFLRAKVHRRRIWPQPQQDEDLVREETHVRSLIASHELRDEVLAVLELSKFRKGLAVNAATFCVRQGEIFGILGVNGAGKTTLFRMLTGDLTTDRGRALLKTSHGLSSIRADIKQWQSSAGYCPQHDGFLEQLSGWDMLALFARLRGVPERIVPEVVRKFSCLVDLESIVNDPIDTYSSGCRRKLSIGLAIIGMPPVVFLDEPTTGVDVVSRKKLWSSLKSLQATASMAIVLSSHSMDEVDFLCDRVTIMIDGEFQCLGTIAHLKAKYAQGYTMCVKTHVEYKDDLDYTNKLLRTIVNTFPETKLRESYECYLEYHMADIGLPWSELFAMAETVKQKLNLLELLLSNTTLDQIYVALAKKEGARRPAAD
ncbi:ABC transporter, putative, partial [Ixodes scapularis]